ncbi:hypothetical protein [Pseudomonas sp. G(2018)]|uniref:hypothetical protein n=1 Tax=Pseudomonas sp. G(2018) TaxID=2502242 RepID=UPI0010F75F5E|nr:hypothetical protein [Pseudomonas sp. G(2018)]
MAMLILYNLNPDLRFDDYKQCARQAGLTYEAAEVHTDSGTLWFMDATYLGEDLGSTSELDWPEKGFFPAFTQRIRELSGAKNDLQAAVSRSVAVPTRHPPSSASGGLSLGLKRPSVVDSGRGSEDVDVLYLNVGMPD